MNPSLPLLITRRACTLLLACTLAACNPAAPDSPQAEPGRRANPTPVLPKSIWTLKDTLDKMNGQRVVAASLSAKAEEAPNVLLEIRFACDPSMGSAALHADFTAYQPGVQQDGRHKGMPFETAPVTDLGGIFITIGWRKLGLIPDGYPLGNVTTVAVRFNEGAANDKLIDGMPALATQFNNQIRLFPFHMERAFDKPVTSLRVAVPAQQGTPMALIDYADPHIAAVIHACEKYRPKPLEDNKPKTSLAPPAVVASATLKAQP
jgi:hypothetical protein